MTVRIVLGGLELVGLIGVVLVSFVVCFWCLERLIERIERRGSRR